jgi:hypothetical protein
VPARHTHIAPAPVLLPAARAPRSPRQVGPPGARPADPTEDPRLARLPTEEEIAAEVRRRPVGAVIADICRDLGIMTDHPLWRELHLAIIVHGGGLAAFVRDMCQRAFATWRGLTSALAAPPLSPEPACTGPP